jgi:hypothetical protein
MRRRASGLGSHAWSAFDHANIIRLGGQCQDKFTGVTKILPLEAGCHDFAMQISHVLLLCSIDLCAAIA